MEEPSSNKSVAQFSIFAWSLTAYAVIVILWGAFVRISGSGDGCGEHWPLCHGELIPYQELRETLKTWIEFGHRIKSGLFGVGVICLVFFAFKLFPAKNIIRKLALCCLCFTVLEGFLGAQLVLARLVADDASLRRVIVIGLHLTNTLVLLAVLTSIAKLSKLSTKFNHISELLPAGKAKSSIVGFVLLAVTGSWAALASTLFPSSSLLSGIMADFDTTSHVLVRVRILHPVLALIVWGLVRSWIRYLDQNISPRIRGRAWFFISGNIVFGLTTLLLLSPTWMKMLHLLLANLSWIALIILMIEEKRLRLERNLPLDQVLSAKN